MTFVSVTSILFPFPSESVKTVPIGPDRSDAAAGVDTGAGECEDRALAGARAWAMLPQPAHSRPVASATAVMIILMTSSPYRMPDALVQRGRTHRRTRQPSRPPGRTAGTPVRRGSVIRVASLRRAGAGEEVQHLADGAAPASGFGQREVGLDLVAVAAAVFLLRHAAARSGR